MYSGFVDVFVAKKAAMLFMRVQISGIRFAERSEASVRSALRARI
jgi:hypothetical protein